MPSPPPTILVVGSTGNTGRTVASTLSSSSLPQNTRILALTRSSSSPAAQALAQFPNVQICEKNWPDIDSAWLKQQNVTRAFIASHNAPNHFAEESTFHLACLLAGVEYVVRISTTAANVTPTCGAYYPRTHWAIEQLLSSPEFASLKWTSLQPNVFTQLYLSPAASLVKQFRKTGSQGPLRLMADAKSPVGVIDPSEIGIFAAKLLLSPSISAHAGKRYVLNGPEDISGDEIVGLVEKAIGEKVKDVRYKDMSFIHEWADGEEKETKSIIRSIVHAPETAWEGKCSASTTSKEVKELGGMKRGPGEVWGEMIAE
ncbi:NAD(P)-binding protein [Ophiobolus disseminans]|uniref:NAD(P)-binding protein n=1 Tax=Ophiobolus disseminans TaxID=1469910 RepID=A0A6A6ZH17_9PLEO|nr:NAD(P)-binding protein [Ophiobolus disseminans]